MTAEAPLASATESMLTTRFNIRTRGHVCQMGAAALCWLGGCAQPRDLVEQFGGMREVMREGRSEPRARLVDVASERDVYAVGALAGLQGEVTIAGGETWVARVTDDAIVATGPGALDGDEAALLTVGRVRGWASHVVAAGAEGAALEALIEQAARARGIDTTAPFPFLIEGERMTLGMHVVNGYCPIGTDPATMDAKPWRWSGEQPGRVLIVGFFAPNAAGIMTHHGTPIHAHAVFTVDGRTVTAHVDALGVPPGCVLKLPSRD